MRGLSLLLLLHFALVTLAPGWIVADFLLERQRVEQELCVQRMVPESGRTCHGECYLMKRLDKSLDREQNLPNELRAIRIGEMIADAGQLQVNMPIGELRLLRHVLKEALLEGYVNAVAPVPWC